MRDEVLHPLIGFEVEVMFKGSGALLRGELMPAGRERVFRIKRTGHTLRSRPGNVVYVNQDEIATIEVLDERSVVPRGSEDGAEWSVRT